MDFDQIDNHLAAVELDAAHESVVRQVSGAVLHVEAGNAKGS